VAVCVAVGLCVAVDGGLLLGWDGHLVYLMSSLWSGRDSCVSVL
jgi:hypothetical protein